MKNRVIALAAVCLLIPGILLAQPAAKKTIAGVWEVKMSPAGQSQSPLLSSRCSESGFARCPGWSYRTEYDHVKADT
jgi:hypothetical protein